MSKQIKPIIYIFITYLIAQFAPVIIGLFSSEEAILDVTIYSNVVSFIVGALVMIYISRKYKMTNEVEKGKKKPLLQVVLYGVLGLFLSLIGQYLATIIEVNFLGETLTSANTDVLLEISNAYPIFILVITIFGPIMEEYVFRKGIFGPLYRHIGGIGAAVVSSLLFAFVHFDGHILLYSVIGFAFSYVYYKSGSILAPIISHILMNAVGVLPLFMN